MYKRPVAFLAGQRPAVLAGGLLGAAQFVLQAVQNLGGVVISGIKKILRIQSPSLSLIPIPTPTRQGATSFAVSALKKKNAKDYTHLCVAQTETQLI
ncbi:hypothetical protein [Deinococcus sp. ME38]|uniref:hypothetical protein n=1 Tax=Deinococcus sp. ME38 TaxID=3400344 RepID=UPI003B590728